MYVHIVDVYKRQTIDYSITSDNYIDLKSEEDLYKVGAITCKANDKELTKGTLSNSSMEITFENPWVTESILTDIYNKMCIRDSFSTELNLL